MTKNSIVAVSVVAVAGTALFTTLLITHLIGPVSYVVLMSVVILTSWVCVLHPRLKKLDLKNLTLTLDRIEKVTARAERMYGSIDNLQRVPLVLGYDKMMELGVNASCFSTNPGAIMRHVAGSIKRERERLARIFVAHGKPEVAEAILDASFDERVFKWYGPEIGLDVEPQPLPHGNFGSSSPPGKVVQYVTPGHRESLPGFPLLSPSAGSPTP
jgi:hypothetical protein